LLSLCVFVHTPEQNVGRVGGQTHLPATQLWPPAQTLPHAPQLLLSVCVSVHDGGQ
jgi:hypothetical protein